MLNGFGSTELVVAISSQMADVAVKQKYFINKDAEETSNQF